ncbi:LLM class flavin-dependent oxidoreductase [Nocardia suismassiliense]|uniref:LLM class flavin-dependent oxidoreductase n=1 Tax=Nocardia suismassiliense TaxID=2077092 RepID=UPI000D1E54EB|nr:LLM class flavin-dependent oxidoreductase [Nocardia suismassiliense]
MSTFTVLRFNFANPGGDPGIQRDAVATALELVRWGETRGIQAVSVDEHHATGHGWCPNPLLAAGLFLSNTQRTIVSVDCALGPLWNPARLAEDIAFLDMMSGGRLHVTIGLGYRPVEYEALAADFHRRGQNMDRLLDHLLAAWTGSAVSTPRPSSRPHPPIYVGGGVRATAERAARRGLPLSLPEHLPDIADHYRRLCTEHGHRPVVIMPPERKRGMIFLHEDPERAWAELGSHILWEATTYGQWSAGDRRSYMHLPGVSSMAEVRESGRYRFLTPDELVEELRVDAGAPQPLVLHPLVGGMPPEAAWHSVELLVTKVLPHV